jgi:hypothetical protein
MELVSFDDYVSVQAICSGECRHSRSTSGWLKISMWYGAQEHSAVAVIHAELRIRFSLCRDCISN